MFDEDHSRLPLLLCSPLGAEILFTVKQRGPLSRAELARILGHSRSTMSAEVEDLLTQTLLRELGVGQSGGGRPPVLFEFNSGAGEIVAIELSQSGMQVAIADLAADILVSRRERLPRYMTPNDVLRRVIALAHDLLRPSTATTRSLVLGIGVSFPGSVLPGTRGAAHSFLLPDWTNDLLKTTLERKFQCPVYVETHANVRALAEWQSRQSRSDRAPLDFLYVKAGPPTTCGFVTAGGLRKGARGRSGQLGHVVINPSGERCACGKIGCLDAEMGRVLQDVNVLDIPEGHNSRRDVMSIGRIVRAATQGDPHATTALLAYSEALASALLNVTSVLDPEVIIVGGCGDAVTESLVMTVQAKLEQYGAEGKALGRSIQPSHLGIDAGIRGASVLVVQELLMHGAGAAAGATVTALGR